MSEMDDTQKLICIYGIASGIAYLHENHFIHRDLKPENILLNSEYYPKISDVGLSKSITSQSHTHSALKGTNQYLAPELCQVKPNFSDLGNPKGMYNAAVMLSNGEGIKQSKALASEYYKKAADQGDTLSIIWQLCFMLEMECQSTYNGQLTIIKWRQIKATSNQ